MCGEWSCEQVDAGASPQHPHDPGAGWTAGPRALSDQLPPACNPSLAGRRQQLLWSLEGACLQGQPGQLWIVRLAPEQVLLPTGLANSSTKWRGVGSRGLELKHSPPHVD